MKNFLLKLSRTNKQIIVCLTDFSIILLSTIVSVYISTDFILHSLFHIQILILISAVCILIFYLMGVYRSVVRFIDLSSILLVIKSIFLCLVVISSFIYSLFVFEIIQILPSLNAGVLTTLMTLTLIISVRLCANQIFSNENSSNKVVIYGAGSAGIQLAGALRVSHEIQPIAFVDSNQSLHNTFIGGLKVLHPNKYLLVY